MSFVAWPERELRDDKFMGPDLLHEDGSPDEALIPPPWIARVSTTQWPGEYFYFNPDTLESTFTHPLDHHDTSVKDSSSPYGTGSLATSR